MSTPGMKLLCFSHAGGSAVAYYKWKKLINPNIEVVAFEYKGRGSKFNQPFYESVAEAVDDAYVNLKAFFNEQQFAFFGHSMGAVMSFELSHRIKAAGGASPVHLFLSGINPPHARVKHNYHTLPDDEFIEKIVAFGGTPKDVMKEPAFMELFLPVLRSDMKLLELYNYREHNLNLDIDMTVLHANNDKLTTGKVSEWRQYTTRNYRQEEFEGDHFYIEENLEKVLQIINNTLVK